MTLNKPTWLGRDAYGQFIRVNPQVCAFSKCGATDDLTVDHIVARHDGGTDDLSNLQILCRPHNSAKGIHADRRFDRTLYFDQPINHSALRAAHRLACWQVVEDHYQWFTRPWSQISRKLYTAAWIVGAGKTIFIPVLAFALNRVILRELGSGHPRVRRVLVLAKELCIRDQIAEDLGGSQAHPGGDLVRYGVVGTGPRVEVIKSGWMFENPIALERADIWVSCVQQLWERNGVPRENLASILAHFDLIVIDEPHVAHDQAMRIVESAGQSLVVGTTGSPITANGAVLRRCVLFSLYTYRQAVEQDNSLKFIDDQRVDLAEIIDEIGIVKADVQTGVDRKVITAVSGEPDYHLQADPVKSVADRVVHYLQECDGVVRAGFGGTMFSDVAKHRPAGAIPSLGYPVHAMIVCDSVEAGRMLKRYLTRCFENDRRKYPLEQGYAVALIHADKVGKDGELLKGERLDAAHPWKRYLETGRLDARCARILIVVGMGREGVNNPYCSVIGFGCDPGSDISAVQRLGRTLRSVHTTGQGGVLNVPVERLDTVKIIIHEAFQSRGAVERAIEFAVHMDEKLQGMQTLAQLVAGADGDPAAVIDGADSLTSRDRILIADICGDAAIRGGPPDLSRNVPGWADWGDRRKTRADAWAKTVIDRPADAWKSIGAADRMQVRSIVTHEWPITDPTVKDIDRFVRIHKPQFIDDLPAYEAEVLAGTKGSPRKFLEDAYQDLISRYHDIELPVFTNVETIRRGLVRDALALLSGTFEGDTKVIDQAMRQAIGQGVKDLLDARGPVQNGGEFDTPKHHALLGRHEIRRELIGFALAMMTRRGFCPRLATAFRIPADGWEDLADVGS